MEAIYARDVSSVLGAPTTGHYDRLYNGRNDDSCYKIPTPSVMTRRDRSASDVSDSASVASSSSAGSRRSSSSRARSSTLNVPNPSEIIENSRKIKNFAEKTKQCEKNEKKKKNEQERQERLEARRKEKETQKMIEKSRKRGNKQSGENLPLTIENVEAHKKAMSDTLSEYSNEDEDEDEEYSLQENMTQRSVAASSGSLGRSAIRSTDAIPGKYNTISDIKTSAISDYTEATMVTSYDRLARRDYEVLAEKPFLVYQPSDGDKLSFVNMINPERANNISDLEDIASALYATTVRDRRGLVSLRAFVSRSTANYTDEEISQIWHRQKSSQYPKTSHTLAFLAREDSHERYREWHMAWVRQMMFTISGIHSQMEIAHTFYRFNWINVKCTQNMKNHVQWYIFRNHVWEPTVLNDLLSIFENFRKWLENEVSFITSKVMENKEEYENESAWVTIMDKVLDKLGEKSYTEKVLQASAPAFTDLTFENRRDRDIALKACQNGVIHCLDNAAVFRPGRVDDCITQRMPTEFDESLTMESPEVKFVLEFYHKVWCDPEVEYFMRKDFASYLRSGNREKLFRAWIGTKTYNAKSTIANMFKGIFGLDNAVSLTCSMYTAKDTAPESTMSQLKMAANAAVAFVNETKEDELLRANRIKEHTGNDYIAFRGNYENMRNGIFQAKLILMSNYFPQFDGGGKGLENRAIFVLFDSYFGLPGEYPEDEEEQYRQRKFPRDMKFDDKIKKNLTGFLWLMVHDYAAYCSEGLTLPKAVREAGHNFWQKENMYGMFCNTMISRRVTHVEVDGKSIETPSAEHRIRYEEIYEKFSTWYEKAFGGANRIPSARTAWPYFVTYLGKQHRGLDKTMNAEWIGYEIVRATDDDEQENDAE